MASRALSTAKPLISFNLLFFFFITLVGSNYVPLRAPRNSPQGRCPRDTLKFGICADVLENLLGLVVGIPPKAPCCNLIEGLVDLEAAVCLCTAIKSNVLGIVNLDIPLSLTLLLLYCGKTVPSGFQCA